MDRNSGYRDPIISVFKDDSYSVDNAVIRSLLEQQSDNTNELDLEHSEKVLNLYTELLKLEYFIEKTWDIKTLETSVVIKFESYNDGPSETKNTIDSASTDDTFYKDISLKCIKNCERISRRLTKYQMEISIVRGYINSVQFRLLEDSVTLLLEIWFTCNRKIKFLRNKIVGIFLRSKLLIIDHELETFKKNLSDPKIIPSYRSFMKILVEQLQDAENSNDQALLDECLYVFLDIEAMFNSLHLNILQSQNKSLRDSIPEEDHHNSEEMDTFSTNTLNEHSRSSSVSTTADLSFMMERTNLSKELPNLLAAFNNAKRLEQELENVRIAPKSRNNVPASSTPSSSSSSMSTLNCSTNENGPCSGTLSKSKLMMMEQHKNSVNHFVSPASYGKSLGGTRGESIINNLYGINRH